MFVGFGTLKTVEEVYDELRRSDADDFEFLFDQWGTRNPDPADPWLLAAAKVLGWTVVTDERKENTRKIPYVCRQQSICVRCVNGRYSSPKPVRSGAVQTLLRGR
ncbi:DUF4411 family protein [Bradyrhizobium sp. BTAi1]|uniref:DUF4411 family protein n=1 Tax=Bradyrhizobium sp. (strain BTAi1 / ATCC BAA-1182) TaxID=288000 RepID=UPI003528F9B2